MPTEVFISYAREDQRIAKRIAKKLEELNIANFLDQKSIEWGDDILDRVTTGVQESSDLIVIVSPASLKSLWVPFEVGLAIGMKRRILVLLTHPSLDIPGYLRQLNFKIGIAAVGTYYSKLLDDEKRATDGKVMVASVRVGGALRSARPINDETDLRLTILGFGYGEVGK